jgi:predicted nuclease of predicted toxin-antitoxin system
MKVAVDENIPLVTVNELRHLGHDVLDVRGTPLLGIPDPDLWALSQAQGRLLITTDTGFIAYANQPHWGLLVVRLRQPNVARIHARAMAAVRQYPPEQWPDLVIVMRDRVKSVRRTRRNEK